MFLHSRLCQMSVLCAAKESGKWTQRDLFKVVFSAFVSLVGCFFKTKSAMAACVDFVGE